MGTAEIAAMLESSRRAQRLSEALGDISQMMRAGVLSLLATAGDTVIVEVSDSLDGTDGVEGEAEENEGDRFE